MSQPYVSHWMMLAFPRWAEEGLLVPEGKKPANSECACDFPDFFCEAPGSATQGVESNDEDEVLNPFLPPFMSGLRSLHVEGVTR